MPLWALYKSKVYDYAGYTKGCLILRQVLDILNTALADAMRQLSNRLIFEVFPIFRNNEGQSS